MTVKEIIRENVKNKARPEKELKAEFLPHVYDGISRMRLGDPWTVAQLCGGSYWKTLALVDRIEIGRIVSGMVSKGELPLYCVNPDTKGPLMYSLLTDEEI